MQMTSPELDVLYRKLLRLYEIELGRVLTESELSAVANIVDENAPGDPSLATGVAQLIEPLLARDPSEMLLPLPGRCPETSECLSNIFEELVGLFSVPNWDDSGESILAVFERIGLTLYVSREASVGEYAIRPETSYADLNMWLRSVRGVS